MPRLLHGRLDWCIVGFPLRRLLCALRRYRDLARENIPNLVVVLVLLCCFFSALFSPESLLAKIVIVPMSGLLLISSLPGLLPSCELAQSPSHCFKSALSSAAFASYRDLVLSSIIRAAKARCGDAGVMGFTSMSMHVA